MKDEGKSRTQNLGKAYISDHPQHLQRAIEHSLTGKFSFKSSTTSTYSKKPAFTNLFQKNRTATYPHTPTLMQDLYNNTQHTKIQQMKEGSYLNRRWSRYKTLEAFVTLLTLLNVWFFSPLMVENFRWKSVWEGEGGTGNGVGSLG